MRHEQLPENKGGRPPPVKPGSSWYLEQEELAPEEIRNLGRYVYLTAFQSVLLSDQIPNENEKPTFDKSASAAAFVEDFGRVNGLNISVIRRWADVASRELAAEYLPAIQAQRDGSLQRARPNEKRRKEILLGYNETLWSVAHVALHGINASLATHLVLVEEVGTHAISDYLSGNVKERQKEKGKRK